MNRSLPGLLLISLLLMQAACSTGPVILTFDSRLSAQERARISAALDDLGIPYSLNEHAIPPDIDNPTLIYPIAYPDSGQINTVVASVEELGYTLTLRHSPYKGHGYSQDRFGIYLMPQGAEPGN